MDNLNGTIIAFGASILYKPSRQKDIDEMPKMGAKMLEGIFVGYVQQAGGGWPGDVDIPAAKDLTNAQLIEEVLTKRVSANEITVMKQKRSPESARESGHARRFPLPSKRCGVAPAIRWE